MTAVKTDLLIIGAGPIGLFTVFEAGLLKMRCHLMDVLPHVGGQLTEIYPKKPIYDIPGFPIINAVDLIHNLMKQVEPFKPTFSLGERADRIERNDKGAFMIFGHRGTVIEAKVIVIAAGLGCFEPRKPPIPDIEKFEGRGVDYFIRKPEDYQGKNVVIAGGGDSALDWTIELADVAQSVTLIHRRSSFRGVPDSVEKVVKLAKDNKVNLITNASVIELEGGDELEAAIVDHNNDRVRLETDYFLPLFGLTPKLGPIAEWGLGLDKTFIHVDPSDYSTNQKGIYAIGDINNYKGKLKLILCGFHEAALMCQSAFHYIYPEQKLSFKYTTVTGIEGFKE